MTHRANDPVSDVPLNHAPVGFLSESLQRMMLLAELANADVELGTYDHRIVGWLAGWDYPTTATVMSLIRRAARPAEPAMCLPWDQVRAITARLDGHNGDSEHETAMRLLKLTEEAGEVAQAYIGLRGQNPRKGVTHTEADVAAELCDVILTAMVALHRFTDDPATALTTVVHRAADRLDTRPAGDHSTGPTPFPDPGTAYANAPDIDDEAAWVAASVADPESCGETGQDYHLRKAALYDRIALADEPHDLFGEAAETALAVALMLVDTDRPHLAPHLAEQADDDPRGYVRHQYAQHPDTSQ
ncbi:MazG-like family protein [Streptomyces acidiscabies]|uniref:MazG-like family protein n=1 Tax=Streptomyces acidiscabies TaxID=42234 RepID=UPI00076EF380|nr:hypothetical protein a10_08636 [Streptomyces acidiscabies]